MVYLFGRIGKYREDTIFPLISVPCGPVSCILGSGSTEGRRRGTGPNWWSFEGKHKKCHLLRDCAGCCLICYHADKFADGLLLMQGRHDTRTTKCKDDMGKSDKM